MLHKILASYHSNEPYDEPQEHPDGPLWPIGKWEWRDIPYGVLIERLKDGKTELYSRRTFADNNNFGIRGYRD